MSVELGTPNACSSCHVKDRIEQVPEDQRDSLKEYADWLNAAQQGNEVIAKLIRETDKWCADANDKWYGGDREKPGHFGHALAALRSGDPAGVQKALALAMRRDGLTPAIARATAIDNLAARGVSDSAKAAAELLADPAEHPTVRAAAVRALSTGNPTTVKRILLPLISDPSRLIRFEATRLLASSGLYQALSAGEQSQVDLALREVKETLMVTADRGGSHMEWAAICEQRGRIPEAIDAYETAIRVEPNMAGPRTNLAALLDEVAQRGDERARLKAEQLRREELPLLARDASLAPTIAILQYRYGLALYLSGDLTKALKQLELAVQLDPNVEDYQLAVRGLKEKIATGSSD